MFAKYLQIKIVIVIGIMATFLMIGCQGAIPEENPLITMKEIGLTGNYITIFSVMADYDIYYILKDDDTLVVMFYKNVFTIRTYRT